MNRVTSVPGSESQACQGAGPGGRIDAPPGECKLKPTVLTLALFLVTLDGPARSQEDGASPWIAGIQPPQYFAVLVADVDTALAWYQSTLGLELLDSKAADDGAWRIVNLSNPSLFVELIFDRRAVDAGRSLGFFKTGFQVPDVERVADRVEASTGERPRIVDDTAHGFRILQLRDPEDNILQLTSPLVSTDAVHYYSPSWSPDGSRIAFYSNRDGNFDIYTIRPDGTDLTRLTDHPANDGEMDWSPDGTRIVFSSGRDHGLGLFIMNADGSEARHLGGLLRASAPAWSPDGTRIAFEGRVDDNRDIWIMDADGAQLRRITDHPAQDFRPAWSSDGSRIAFMSKRAGTYDIHVMAPDGTGQRQVTNTSDHAVCPAWSPTQDVLLFTVIGDSTRLMRLDLDGGSLRPLRTTVDQENVVSWSPDGTRIVVQGSHEGAMTLEVIDGDGKNSVRLLP